MTVTFEILSRLCLRNSKALEVDTWHGHWFGGCKSAASWCDLDLTFDIAVVTLRPLKSYPDYISESVRCFLCYFLS